jgi:hypothetical protein
MPDRAPLPSDLLFDQRNGFLDLLLGLISLSERMLSTVVDLAPPSPPLQATPRSLPSEGRVLR